MKKIFASIVFAAMAVSSFAGGLLTNTNQSASFVRNPMRYASLETDAIYFNPAGTAFFNEGWAFSANWQMIWQDRDILFTNPAIEPSNTKYKGSVYVPCMPTLYAAYKKGNWTFSGYFGMPGGGGKAEFENGLPLFNNLIGGLGLKLGLPVKITGASEFESTQYLFSLQLGAAYKINDNLSAYAGLRTNYVSNNYKGTIKANTNLPTGALNVATVNLDMDQSGVAFAPIIGIDYKVGKFNLAAKYEFRAVTTVKNDTKAMQITANQAIDQLGMGISSATIEQAAKAGLGGYLGGFADGNKLRSDAPALLTLGASYDITDRWKVMAGYNYYFDKDAKIESLLGGNTMKTLSRNTFEILGGIEFKATDKLLLSAGFQFSDFGVNESYLSDISFINDSFTTGLGAKYSFNENWDLNVGFCYANYADGSKFDKISSCTSRYLRKTYNVAVGVDFRF